MKERDYLWCLLNQLLDDQEELDQLCPTCRAEAEQERCPGCGALIQASGVNPSFDMERFRRLKEGEGTLRDYLEELLAGTEDALDQAEAEWTEGSPSPAPPIQERPEAAGRPGGAGEKRRGRRGGRGWGKLD